MMRLMCGTSIERNLRQMSSHTNRQETDDEPDEWDQRINKTGCAEENLKLQLCHADTGDWRKCINEMNAFRECWDKFNNNQRTQTKNNDLKDF